MLGVASIGLASATANLVGKGLLRRARPDRAGVTVPAGRMVRMPGSTSFPSGHSASAFAFATAVGDELPLAWLPLHALAAAITYSRVHTGVHYPGDVLVGSLMGTGAAVAVRYTGRALTRRSAHPSQPGGPVLTCAALPGQRWPFRLPQPTDLAHMEFVEPGGVAAGYRLSRSRSLLVSRNSM
jgi:hypothetical protein